MRWFWVGMCCIILGVCLIPMLAEAAGTLYIDVTATGSDNASPPGPPTDFTAIATSDFEVSITWSMGINATHTEVRRKIGSYPDNITDGVEVYYGTGTSVVDGVDMSFLDEDVYYRAWSYSNVTTLWSTTYAQDIVEVGGAMANALIMSGAGLILLCFTFGGMWSKVWPITIAGGIGWAGFAGWLFTNGTEWSLYWFMGFVAVLMFIISIAIPIWMRQKPGTELEDDDQKAVIKHALASWNDQDQLAEAYPRRGRRRRVTESDDLDG